MFFMDFAWNICYLVSDARKKNQKQTFCLLKNTAQLVQVRDTHFPCYPYCSFLFFPTHDCRLINGPLNIFLFNKFWSKQYHTIKRIFTNVITAQNAWRMRWWIYGWSWKSVTNRWPEYFLGCEKVLRRAVAGIHIHILWNHPGITGRKWGKEI